MRNSHISVRTNVIQEDKATNISRTITIYYNYDKETRKHIEGEYRVVRVSPNCTLSNNEVAMNYGGFTL